MKRRGERPGVRAVMEGLKRAENFEAQTLLLSKDTFGKAEAVKWIEDNGFVVKPGAPDETENEWRFRQFEPERCVRDSFKTFEITDGVQAVGCKVKTEEAATKPEPRERRYLELESRSIDEKERTVHARATLRGVDRHGTLIEPAGFKARLDRFLANPVLLWAHNHFAPPIGRVEDLTIGDDDVSFVGRFASTPFAEEIFTLFRDGFLKAFSIGFYPLKVRTPTAEESAAWGKDLYAVIEEIELLEISGVPIGSNVGALTLALPGTEDQARAWYKAQEDVLAWARSVREAGKPARREMDAEAMTQALVAVAEQYNVLGERIKAAIEVAKPDEEPEDEPEDEPEKPADEPAGEGAKGAAATGGDRAAVLAKCNEIMGQVASFHATPAN